MKQFDSQEEADAWANGEIDRLMKMLYPEGVDQGFGAECAKAYLYPPNWFGGFPVVHLTADQAQDMGLSFSEAEPVIPPTLRENIDMEWPW